MVDKYRLEVVTPKRIVAETDVLEVVAPGELGEFGILPGHTEYLSLLRPGEVRLKEEGGERYFAVGRGFAEAGPARLTILTEFAEEAKDLDPEEIRRELSHDQSRLKSVDPTDSEYVVLTDRIERNQARLAVASRR